MDIHFYTHLKRTVTHSNNYTGGFLAIWQASLRKWEVFFILLKTHFDPGRIHKRQTWIDQYSMHSIPASEIQKSNVDRQYLKLTMYMYCNLKIWGSQLVTEPDIETTRI